VHRDGAVAADALNRVVNEPGPDVGAVGRRVAGRVGGPAHVVRVAGADVDGDPLAGDRGLTGGRRVEVNQLVQGGLIDVGQDAAEGRVRVGGGRPGGVGPVGGEPPGLGLALLAG